MAFRGKFTFGTDEEAPTQQYQQQWQGGQMVPHKPTPPVTFGFGQSQPRHYQAGDERYVSTVMYSETRTNDASVSLQKAANRQADGTNSNLLNLVVGTACAIAVGKFALPLLRFGLEVFGLVVLIAFAAGYFLLRNNLAGKNGSGGR